MSSKRHEKKERLEKQQFERSLQNAPDDTTVNVISEVAMGGGDEQVFEKKLTKEEKKALAKAKREAKRKAKTKDSGDYDDDNEAEEKLDANQVLDGLASPKTQAEDGMDHEAADALASAGTICTFSASRKGVDHSSRDINVQNFTMQNTWGMYCWMKLKLY